MEDQGQQRATDRRTPGHPGGEGVRLLAEVAETDERLLELSSEWKDLARTLEALRREIVVTSAQALRSRTRAANEGRERDGDLQETGAAVTMPSDDSAPRLMVEFVVALRKTEERRVGLHAAMDALRTRRQALLDRLPASVSRACRSIADMGLVPVVSPVARGACGVCNAPLSEVVLATLSHDAWAVCARCDRLLYSAGPPE